MPLSSPVSSLLIAFVSTVLVTAALLPWLRSFRIRKEVRIDTPETHQGKRGTPSMGGLALLTGMLAACLVANRSPVGLLLALVTVFFGAVGFWDDYIKATGAENRGLKARHKLLLQLIGCLLFLVAGKTLQQHGAGFRHEDFAGVQGLGYSLWIICVIVMTCNAANIADGLDGLAAGLTVISATALGVVAVFLNHTDVAVFCAALAGASAGFLMFNSRKALLFMGDTGSLALGAGLATSALVLGREWLLPFLALPFAVDALSVVVQVAYFKRTGKRIFRMAPIHHGFELQGWSEWRIVLTFWVAGLVAAFATVFVWRAWGTG